MSDHCKFCKKEVKRNGIKRRRFCKGTDCQKKYRMLKYGGVIPTNDPKRCSNCSKTKPGYQFHIDRGTKDGRTHRCKVCIKHHHEEYGRRNPHNKPSSVRSDIGNIRYFKILKRDKYCCQICGIKVTAVYDRKNPPSREQQWEDTACELDHIIPRSKGGATNESNLQVTCRKCNKEKGVKIPDRAYDTEEGNKARTVAA